MLINDNQYLSVIDNLKSEIQKSQYSAALAVNSELTMLYYRIGKVINEYKTWGNKFIDNLSRDLKIAFPNSTGYSVRNLKYMVKLSSTYTEEFVQQAVAQIKKPEDNATIGLLLCKSKNNLVAEYSLRDMNKPMGISEYRVSGELPEELKAQLPSIEDIQSRIK